MAKSKKVLKEFVLDSDTDSNISKIKQEETKSSKTEEAISQPVEEKPKAEFFCDTTPTKQVPKEPKEKKPRKPKKEIVEMVKPAEEQPAAPIADAPVAPVATKKATKKEPKPKVVKPVSQMPKPLTEAQIRAKIEKEYQEKENMKAKIRRELEQEYAEKHSKKTTKKVGQKRASESEDDIDEISLGDDLYSNFDNDEEDYESEMDYGQAQIELGNRKAVRAPKSVETMYKQIFGK